jgi:hypothetical protein
MGGRPVSEPTVIKFPDEFDQYGSKNPFGTPKEQIERMGRANEFLKRTRSGPNPIEFAEILEIHPDAEEPYLLQKKVGGHGEVLINANDLMESIMGRVQGRPFAYSELSQKFPPAMQRAVARLYYSIGINKLISTDLSLGNIYFKKVGEEWIAGILDVDHVVSVREAVDDATWKWIEKIIADPEYKSISSVAVDRRAMSQSPLTFMEKMFESTYGGNTNAPWVIFDSELNRFIQPSDVNNLGRNLIDPSIIKEYFPNFGKGLEPPVAPPHRQGALVVPLRHFAANSSAPAQDSLPAFRKAA